MKTEEQVKDIIRHFNGEIISLKNDAIDSLYKESESKASIILEQIAQLRYGIELLQYVLDDNCMLGEDY